MVTPRQILDLQGDLAERLEDPEGKLATYLNLVSAASGIGIDSLSEVHRNPAFSVVARLSFEHVLTGKAFRVAANMTAEIERRAWGDATEVIPEDGMLTDFAPPRHRGFAYLEKPVHYHTSDNMEQSVVAFVWGLARTEDGTKGYLISLWGDIDVEIDEVLRSEGAASLKEWTPETHHWVFGRWAPVTGFWAPLHETVGPSHYEVTEEYMADVRARPGGREAIRYPQSAGRCVIALWQLLCETVDTEHHTVEPATPSKPKRLGERKRGVRPEVNVVALRKPARPNLHPGTGTKRTTRSWVEGGYKQVFWTGPGRKIPVTRTVAGHWSVSDEDLPIRNRPTVYDLRR